MLGLLIGLLGLGSIFKGGIENSSLSDYDRQCSIKYGLPVYTKTLWNGRRITVDIKTGRQVYQHSDGTYRDLKTDEVLCGQKFKKHIEPLSQEGLRLSNEQYKENAKRNKDKAIKNGSPIYCESYHPINKSGIIQPISETRLRLCCNDMIVKDGYHDRCYTEPRFDFCVYVDPNNIWLTQYCGKYKNGKDFYQEIKDDNMRKFYYALEHGGWDERYFVERIYPTKKELLEYCHNLNIFLDYDKLEKEGDYE